MTNAAFAVILIGMLISLIAILVFIILQRGMIAKLTHETEELHRTIRRFSQSFDEHRSATTDSSIRSEEFDTPGRYRVMGVEKDTGDETAAIIEAQSRGNAKAKAELRGIIVTDVAWME